MDMDIPKLAAETAALLAPFLPYLIKGGKIAAKAAFEETGKKFVDSVWDKAEELWDRLKPKVKANASAQSAIEKAARKPDDPRVLGNLEVELEEIFEQDISFAQSIKAGNYNVVVGGDVSHANILNNSSNNKIIHAEHYYEGAPSNDAEHSPESLTLAYLRNLAQDCEKLPLGVIHRNFQKIVHEDSVLLQNVYTDLDVQPRIREEKRQKDIQLMERESQNRVPVLSVLEDPKLRRLVLLGDPGSGKTTCVHYITFALAMIQQKLAGTESLLPEDSKLARYFPIRLVLREVAALHIPNNTRTGSVDILWNALRADLAKRIGEEQAKQLFPHLQKRIQNTPCLVMLDGLDEVPESEERRARLLESIEHFSASLPKESIVMVTARPYAYDDPKWHLPRFETLELLPFSEKQMEGFIKRFYLAVRHVMDWDENTANRRGDELNAEVKKEEYLRELAERPLLLTLIATVDTSGGKLPEDRADLYEETVGLLLQRWQRRIETRKEDGSPLMEESILKALSIDTKKVREALHKLAYDVHERQGHEETARKQNAPADIRKEEILGAFASLLPDDTPTKALLTYLETRAGLLLGRGEGVYIFPHRSFQEYLAACYLNDQPNPTERLNEVFLCDPNWWREVVLLGIAKIQRGGLGSAVNAVNTLVPCNVEEMEQEITSTDWLAAALAGQALIEMRLQEQSADKIFYKTIIKRIANWLVHLLEQNALTPRERAEAGNTLAKLGDPRVGVTNDFLFCEIPAGKFMMGSKKDENDSSDDEYPQFEYNIPYKYFISRYPITNQQFDLFVNDPNGYIKKDWWTKAGMEWRKDRKDHKRYGGAFDLPNHPVVDVTWYEATAFTRWMTDRLQVAGSKLQVWKDRKIESLDLGKEKFEIRLPTEAEWERAARGENSSHYPWGDEITPNHANYSDTNLNVTSAVGAFPLGTNKYGLLDMSGNVWEWCATEGQDNYEKYLKKENNKPEGNVARVVRGGSCSNVDGYLRCAFRFRYYPAIGWRAQGFRVVASFPISLPLRSGS